MIRAHQDGGAVLDLSRRSDIATVTGESRDHRAVAVTIVFRATRSDGTPDSLDTQFVRMPLADAGFPPRVRTHIDGSCAKRIRRSTTATCPSDGRRTWIVPGRIEVFGKHVDYAGGRSLLCTVQRGIVMAARRARGAHAGAARRSPPGGDVAAVRWIDEGRNLPWTVYPQTVLHRLQLNFGDVLRGADIAIASNLPPAAGVSSSSALVVGLTLALAALSDLPSHPAWKEAIPDRLALAGYIGALENGIRISHAARRSSVSAPWAARRTRRRSCAVRRDSSTCSRGRPCGMSAPCTWPQGY